MESIYLILISAISIYGLHAILKKIYWYNTGRTIDSLRAEMDAKGSSHNSSELNKLKRLFLYPTILCRLCMTSFWGSIFYWTWGWILGGATITAWTPSLFAIAGVLVLMIRNE